MLPDAVQVADPFHVVRLAQPRARRVPPPGAERDARPSRPQGRPALPLPGGRLVMARRTAQRTTARTSCSGCSHAGDPRRRGVVWPGTPRRSCARSTTTPTTQLADEWVDEIVRRLRQRRDATRGPTAGPHDRPLARPDPRLAPLTRVERTDRSSQQPRSNASNASRSGSAPSSTTESAPCSTPAEPNWDLLPSITPP